MTPFQFGQKIAAQPTFGDYAHQLNKFYNPWSKAWHEPATDGIEKGLQYAGRTAMGIGGAAAAAAGGLTAAPALASVGNTATAAAGSFGTAAATHGQRMMDAVNRTAPRAVNAASKTMNMLNRVNYEPGDVAKDVYNAGTGNFDQIRGPSLVKGAPFPGGAPTLPSPLEMARTTTQLVGDAGKYVAGVGSNMAARTPR